MEIVFRLIVFVVVVLFTSILTAVPVMWLWDWLAPDLFHLHTITLWQAWGLATLCGFLFKSYSSSSSSKS
jgi:hypothetical protein